MVLFFYYSFGSHKMQKILTQEIFLQTEKAQMSEKYKNVKTHKRVCLHIEIP